jgi:hypothetical protein
LPFSSDPDVFRRAAVGRFPFRSGTTPGLSRTLEDLFRNPSPRPGHRRTTACSLFASLLPWAFPPLRRSKLEKSTSRYSLPASALAVAVKPHLVAGFHTRFVPPLLFPTTVTACSSSSPVVCFNHSRPWGLLSLLSAQCPARQARRLSRPNAGVGYHTEDSRTVPPITRRNGPSPRNHRSDRQRQPVRLPLPWCVRQKLSAVRPLSRTFVPPLRPLGLPRSDHCAGKPPQPSLGPTPGVASPVRSDQQPRVTAAIGWFPPGTDPRGPACAPDPFVSQRAGRLRLPTSSAAA